MTDKDDDSPSASGPRTSSEHAPPGSGSPTDPPGRPASSSSSAPEDSAGRQGNGDASGGGSFPRSRVGGVEANLPEPLRRLLEAGLGRLGDRPELLRQRLAELKLPREAWSAILSQLDDGKSGLYRLIAKEVRDLLESTNFAEDLVRALTTLSFEMKTEIRFIPNDKGGARPSVQSAVRVKPAEDKPASTTPADAGAPKGPAAGSGEVESVAPVDTTARRATPDKP